MTSKAAFVSMLLVFGGIAAGCGASDASQSGFPSPPGSYGAADAGAPALGGGDAGPGVCGDRVCNAGESCSTCAIDCGQCAACPLAPSCSNALGIPATTTNRADLSQGGSDADAGADAGDAGPPRAIPGTDGCSLPQLRMRVSKITTYKGGGQIYCVIQSSDGASSEAALTTKTKSLGNNETNYFDPTTASFWGQTKLHPTENNLTVTYDCFRVVDNTAWANALKALGDAAQQAGGIAGPYGWAFGAGAAAASAAAAAVAATNGDEHDFNAQQTLDKNTLLDLTNGRTWTIRKSGGSFLQPWDWEIEVESWGCADGTMPAK